MNANFSAVRFTAKAILVSIAVVLSMSSFAKDAETIGYDSSSGKTTIQIRKVETDAVDTQKRLVMKTILYVHDTEIDGKVNSQIVGAETRVYNPETAQVTHVSIVGIDAYPVETNGAYVIIAPGAKNVSLKGDNNRVFLGGDHIPPATNK